MKINKKIKFQKLIYNKILINYKTNFNNKKNKLFKK